MQKYFFLVGVLAHCTTRYPGSSQLSGAQLDV